VDKLVVEEKTLKEDNRMYNEPVKMLKTLKSGHGASQKVWLEGEIVYPPLPAEIQRELKMGSIFCVVVGKEPKPKFDRAIRKHYEPELPPVDPILEDVRKRTEELVKKETTNIPSPETSSTTQGSSIHTSAPVVQLVGKRRKL
jgi:hypothetical protein